MKIVADHQIPFVKEYFANDGELILKPGREISNADVKDADILLVRSITKVNESLLANSSIKFVGSITAGADHLDTVWLDKADIKWCTASGFNAPPVADYVISVIAALNHHQWLGKENLRAAVIGVGNVGKIVSERLKLLNYEVILCDPIREQQENNFISCEFEDIADVDLISLHVPLTKTGSHPTYHLVDKHFIKRQKKSCVLINTSRGDVINSQALMLHGIHLQWCFDVWEKEPNINLDQLLRAVIGTPHIAGYSVQSKIRGIDLIYQEVCKTKLITKKNLPPILFPQQQLNFVQKNMQWQDVVLGVFNPLLLTTMMKTTLIPAKDIATKFDSMRHQFNYRHEFAFTNIAADSLAIYDQTQLQGLGFHLI